MEELLFEVNEGMLHTYCSNIGVRLTNQHCFRCVKQACLVQAELVIRSGKHGPFLGCSHYPDCDYIRPLKSQADGHISSRCWKARVPILRRCHGVTPGRFGMFIGCSRYPECEHAELIDKPDETAISRVRNADRVIWCSVAPVSVKPFIPAIATLIASSY